MWQLFFKISAELKVANFGFLMGTSSLTRKTPVHLKLFAHLLGLYCWKRIVIKSRDYRAWRTWHHCIVHVIEPVRVNNDRKFLCNQKTKTKADIRMYNRVNWPVRELYSMWSGSEKINNFKTYCDFWRELEDGTAINFSCEYNLVLNFL